MDMDGDDKFNDEWTCPLPLADDDAVLAAAMATLDIVPFVSPAPVTLSSVLNLQPNNVSGLRLQPGRAVLEPVEPQWDESSLDPWNLLQRALHEHHPLLYVRSPPTRRVKQKGRQELGSVIKKLHKNVRYMTWRIDHDKLCAARDEFVRRYAAAACQPWGSVVRTAKRLFNEQCREYKNAWTVVDELGKLMFTAVRGHGRRLRDPPALAWLPQSLAGDKDARVQGSLEVCGILASYNTDFGLREPRLVALVEAGAEGDALLNGMLNIPIYKWYFAAFRDRMQYLASKLDLSSWAVCMELSTNAEHRGRIQLHVMFAPTISWSGHARNLRKVTIPMSELVWDGVVPDVRPSCGSGRSRQIAEAFQAGLYYVLCDKIGGMYKDSSLALFKDSPPLELSSNAPGNPVVPFISNRRVTDHPFQGCTLRVFCILLPAQAMMLHSRQEFVFLTWLHRFLAFPVDIIHAFSGHDSLSQASLGRQTA